MKITGYGNASVKIETEGQVFFFDPYNRGHVPTKESTLQRERREAAFRSAQRVFITHGHFDHLGSVTALYGEGETEIYCTDTPARTLASQGFAAERIRLIGPGETVSFGGASITAYHTKHCRFNAGEIGRVLFRHQLFGRCRQLLRLLKIHADYPAKDECLMYEICGDGKRVLLLGSAGLDKNTAYPTGADALILPYQGRSDMADYCVKLVEKLAPKQVILDHYDDSFPPMTCLEDVSPFVEQMRAKHANIRTVALEEGQTLLL